jgi:Dolichyl-phosphate-mannose-protein mannosyltransferase
MQSDWRYGALWAVWLAAVGAIVQTTGAIHHDMAEAFSWGQHWPQGTYKHPPLSAWMAGGWFSVFPRWDAAFYLLSAVNAALGALGAAQLARVLVEDARDGQCVHSRAASSVWELAVPLAMATPTFSILALTFNANTVLLAVWPWTAWAFVQSVRSPSSITGAVFGLLGGLALLGKYTSLLLLLSCLGSAILHPDRRRYFASPAPYAAVAVALVVTAPHAIWSILNGFPAVGHAQATIRPWDVTLVQALGTTAGVALLALVPTVALRLAQGVLVLQRFPNWIAVLALGPAAAILMLGFTARLGISTNFLIPALYGLPALLLLGTRSAPLMQPAAPPRLWRLVLAAMALVLLLAPLAAVGQFKFGADAAVEPRRELAIAATALWRELTGAPLRITAGSAAYGSSMPFYSPDRPADFTDLDLAKAPWVREADIRRHGLLVACLTEDTTCQAAVRGRPAAETAVSRRLTITRQVWGWTGPEFTFDITMFPPARAVATLPQ